MFARHQLPVFSPGSAGAIVAAMRGLASGGSAQRALSDKLCAAYAAREAVLVDSGTSALALALASAASLRENRPTALPAYSCWDLASAAVGAGVPVILYDVDPHTLAPEPLSLRRALAHGVSSVVLVHLYGIPVDLADLVPQIREAGALVIEDTAQAFGARVEGERAGRAGDYTVLSFGRGKGLSGGRGGALLCRSAAVNDMVADVTGRDSGARALSVLGAQWLLGRPALYSIPAGIRALHLGETVYHPPHAPSAASEVCARAVLATWDPAEAEVRVRAERAAVLLEMCDGPFRPVAVPSNAQPSWLRLPLVGTDARAREVADPAARRLGVMPGYPTPLSRLPQLQSSLRGAREPFKGAEELAARLVTLPVHSRLTSADLTAIVRWLARGRTAVAGSVSSVRPHAEMVT